MDLLTGSLRDVCTTRRRVPYTGPLTEPHAVVEMVEADDSGSKQTLFHGVDALGLSLLSSQRDSNGGLK